MRTLLKDSFKIAAAFIGTVVGAGFATGKEIVQFFTIYGMAGIIGVFITGMFFIWIGTKIMLISNEIKAESHHQLNEYLFGKKIGALVNGIFVVILFGVTSIMIAGTGAIFSEQMEFPSFIGITVAILLCYFVLTRGINGVFLLNIIVVPVMICFSVSIGLLLLPKAVDFLTVPVMYELTEPGWFLSAFAYIGFNLTMAQTVLVPIGMEIEDKRTIKVGGAIGGAGLLLILITGFIALSSMPNLESVEIPMGEVIKTFGSLIHLLYISVILGEILTTVIGNAFGLTKQIQHLTGFSEKNIIIVILIVCLLISRIGFGTLLSILYPIFGGIGVLTVLMIAFQPKKTR
ncbi:YkvI family membrane protein [Pseudalkalibacillus caeni]|uniref:Transporter n=1 Tax=Exobacillus caeni TaxID=2574798 RepID=A0A5R9FD66_9BACL|nr:hypothetical protein [Pseudalkalibacillus caeni]TLS37595.1 hypothetical protein FCL54_10680 [Pseudalkalibacillus caeni]